MAAADAMPGAAATDDDGAAVAMVKMAEMPVEFLRWVMAFLFGLVAVVLVLLVLFPPVDGLVPLGVCVLGGVTWYSGSSIGSSSQLPASATKEYGSPAQKAVVPSTVFPVNIMFISSRYSGKPSLNFIQSE